MIPPRFLALTLAGTLAALLAGAAPLHAQEGAASIKVTSVLNADGTRTDTQKDLDSHTSESKTYDASKKLIQRWDYTINDQGFELEGVCYNAKDQIVGRVSYTYDAFGHLGEMLEKAPNGTVLRRTVYHRDPSGKLTGTDFFDGQGNPLSASGDVSTRKKGRSK
jgi:hypothetical protein